jgi:hypothetical protein
MSLYVLHDPCYSVSGINQLSLFNGEEVRWEQNFKMLLRRISCYQGLISPHFSTHFKIRYSVDYLT